MAGAGGDTRLVVYTEDREESNRLQGDPRNPLYSLLPYGSGCVFTSPEWVELNELRSYPHYPLGLYGGMIARVPRETPSGDHGLVAVGWVRSRNGGSQVLQVTWLKLDPESVKACREVTMQAVVAREVLTQQSDEAFHFDPVVLRFYAGQPDQIDPTRWTIRYSVARKQGQPFREGLIEMQLAGDVDSFPSQRHLRIRAGAIPVAVRVVRPDGSVWATP